MYLEVKCTPTLVMHVIIIEVGNHTMKADMGAISKSSENTACSKEGRFKC